MFGNEMKCGFFFYFLRVFFIGMPKMRLVKSPIEVYHEDHLQERVTISFNQKSSFYIEVQVVKDSEMFLVLLILFIWYLN